MRQLASLSIAAAAAIAVLLLLFLVPVLAVAAAQNEPGGHVGRETALAEDHDLLHTPSADDVQSTPRSTRAGRP